MNRRKRNAAPSESLIQEVAFDLTRSARLLADPSGGVRVSLFDVSTGEEFGNVPLADRSLAELSRAVGVVLALRERLPAPISGEILDELRQYDDRRVYNLAQATHIPAVAAAASEEMVRRVAAERALVNSLENDRLRWASQEVYASRAPNAYSRKIAIEDEIAARGARFAHDLSNPRTASQVDLRKQALIEEVERTIAEGREVMDGARTFVRERSRFEGLLPRESGIRSAHASINDLEQEYLPAARAALDYARTVPRKAEVSPEVVDLRDRTTLVYEDAVAEFPSESLDGEVTTAEILSGLLSHAEIDALALAGRLDEAKRRVAASEARLAAARRGINPSTISQDIAVAPPGSFATFLRTPGAVPFTSRFRAPKAEDVSPAAARTRAARYATMQLQKAKGLLFRIPHREQSEIASRLPSEHAINSAQSLADLNKMSARIDEALAVIRVRVQAAEEELARARAELTSFDAIERWYKNLDSRHRVTPDDFTVPVTLSNGKVLTVAAVRALPLKMLLANMWGAAGIESSVKSGIGKAIEKARAANTPETQAIPVVVTWNPTLRTDLVARMENGNVVIDAPPRFGGGYVEEVRPRGAYARTRRYGLVSRPAGYGTVPNGYVSFEATHGRDPFPYGIVTYAKPLPRSELYRYEMRPVWDRPEDAFDAMVDDQPKGHRNLWLVDTQDVLRDVEPGEVLGIATEIVQGLAGAAMDHTRVWPLGQYDARTVAPILLARAGVKIPEKPAPIFGDLDYDDSGRYFGSIVELAPAGRVSPAWTGTLYSVNSRGETAVVTHPSWDGYWTGADVPTVTVPLDRIVRVVEWHDQKGERGTPFDPGDTHDLPETVTAARRVAAWREWLHTDLRAPPATPTVIVYYQHDGWLTVAIGEPKPRKGSANAHFAGQAVLEGVRKVWPNLNSEATQQTERAVRRSETRHAGGWWDAATFQMGLIRDPERYREGAVAAAESVARALEGGGRRSDFQFRIAGPPFTDAGVTFESFRSLRDRITDALVAGGIQRATAWFDSEAIDNAIKRGWWHDSFAPKPENKLIRKTFTQFTGQKLPATLKATQELLNGRTSFRVVEGV